MDKVIVYNQAELNAVPDNFEGLIEIRGGDWYKPIIVDRHWGNSSVEARENSSVEAWGNSSVEAWGNSSVVARGNSSVEARENSSVEARENSSVDLNGYAQARVMSERANCKTKGNARLILPFSCIEDYMAYYGIKDNGDTVTMYKAVRKENKYHSDWDPDFVYEIGKTATEKCDTNVLDDCGRGLHVATLDWALRFGCGWNNLAIIECEVPKDKVVVPKFSEGKIRTSELKVIREVPLEECGVYGKVLANQRANK